MDTQTAAEAYRVASVENAPPIKIIRMLYQGALRFLSQAIEAAREENGVFTDRVMRADQIVVELRLALDRSANEELCDDLERLYLYVEERFAKAIATRDVEPLGEAQRVLSTLLEGWNQVDLATAEAA